MADTNTIQKLSCPRYNTIVYEWLFKPADKHICNYQKPQLRTTNSYTGTDSDWMDYYTDPAYKYVSLAACPLRPYRLINDHYRFSYTVQVKVIKQLIILYG